jgi:NAD-dependent deacetylase
VESIKESKGIPRCACGGIIKPDVVLYEENLDQEILRQSIEAITKANMLIVGGTSLNVYPAAGLLQFYSGKKLVLINKSTTAFDSRADLVIHDSISKTLMDVI